jgi:hypothetical protein
MPYCINKLRSVGVEVMCRHVHGRQSSGVDTRVAETRPVAE